MKSSVQDLVYAFIDVLYTRTLAEDQNEDTREDAYSKNFRCHSSSHFQRHCDFTDCHPFLSVNTFDHDSAAALAIVFEVSIPETTYRFPCCRSVFPMTLILLRPSAPILVQ